MSNIFSRIGQPKLVTKKKLSNPKHDGNFYEETRSQLIMSMPYNVFKSHDDLGKFFEQAVCAEINNIHKQMLQLEVLGRASEWVTGGCNG